MKAKLKQDIKSLKTGEIYGYAGDEVIIKRKGNPLIVSKGYKSFSVTEDKVEILSS